MVVSDLNAEVRAALLYGTACRMALSEPKKAEKIWREAADRLCFMTIIDNREADTTIRFLWEMARRRWHSETGLPELDDTVLHQWY